MGRGEGGDGRKGGRDERIKECSRNARVVATENILHVSHPGQEGVLLCLCVPSWSLSPYSRSFSAAKRGSIGGWRSICPPSPSPSFTHVAPPPPPP